MRGSGQQEYFIRMGIPTSVVGTAKTIFVNKAIAEKLKAAQGITIKTGETIKQGNFRGIVGTIERLFKTSAEFCLELEARAGELPSKRVRKEESTDEGVPDLDELKRRKSLNQRQTARYFNVGPRTIFNWTREGKLNPTPKRRIAVDQKFEKLYKERHLPTHEK